MNQYYQKQHHGARSSMAKEEKTDLDDCYFYFYSTCTKGASCPFRHCPQALGTEVVCPGWIAKTCQNASCRYRHMNINKMRNTTLCYWESTPTGCLKPHCVFMHSKPRAFESASTSAGSSRSAGGGETQPMNPYKLVRKSTEESHDDSDKSKSLKVIGGFGSDVELEEEEDDEEEEEEDEQVIVNKSSAASAATVLDNIISADRRPGSALNGKLILPSIDMMSGGRPPSKRVVMEPKQPVRKSAKERLGGGAGSSSRGNDLRNRLGRKRSQTDHYGGRSFHRDYDDNDDELEYDDSPRKRSYYGNNNNHALITSNNNNNDKRNNNDNEDDIMDLDGNQLDLLLLQSINDNQSSSSSTMMVDDPQVDAILRKPEASSSSSLIAAAAGGDNQQPKRKPIKLRKTWKSSSINNGDEDQSTSTNNLPSSNKSVAVPAEESMPTAQIEAEKRSEKLRESFQNGKRITDVRVV